MKINNKIYLITLVIAILIVILHTMYRINMIRGIITYEDSLKYGDKAFKFEKTDKLGNKIVISNKRCILLFFNASCYKCIGVLPIVNNWYKSYKNKGVEIIGISKDNIDKTNRIITDFNVSFPVIVDYKMKIFRKYKIQGVPKVIYIDSTGKILYISNYGCSGSKMDSDIKKILGLN